MTYKPSRHSDTGHVPFVIALLVTALVMCNIANAQTKTTKGTKQPTDELADPQVKKKKTTITPSATITTKIMTTKQLTEITKQLMDELAEVQQRVATLEEETKALRAELDSIRKQPNQPEPDSKRVVNKGGAQDGGGGEAVAAELDKLQGTWVCEGYNGDGEENYSERPRTVMLNSILTIKGNKWTEHWDIPGIAKGVDSGTLKLHPTTNPKGIDLTLDAGTKKFIGKTRSGSYEEEGDKLRLVLGDYGGERPNHLKSKQGDNLKSVGLFKRQK